MSQKVEAQGGKSGKQWDDGADHDGVTKIHVRGGRNGVQYVKFDYVNNEQLKDGPIHGLNDRGFTQTLEINHPDEYLVSVEGYYDGSGVIQALQFKTNKKSSELIGYDEGTKFSLEIKGGRITGFHGYAEKNLYALGAYFVPSSSPWSPPNKLDAQGGNGGSTWDDGAYHGIRKVYVGKGDSGVTYVKFEYDNGGKLEIRDHGRKKEEPQECVLDYPNEYITSVEGTYDKVNAFPSNIITSLTFKTSRGRTSPSFGTVAGTKFVLKDNGRKLVGFHGRGGDAMDAIGAYFAPNLTWSPPNKLEAHGGNGGNTWDDGFYHGLRKVYVGRGDSGVTYVKFDYDKGGKVETRDHGRKKEAPQEFVLDHPEEYIASVEGTYDKVNAYPSKIITSLTFKTSKGRTSPPFGSVAGTKFVLEEKGCKLVGFHGRGGYALDAIGAYFAPLPTPLVPAKTLQAQGGNGGASWDDGIYDGVRKVYVGQGDSGIAFVKFEYDKGEERVVGDGHGKKSLLGTEEFELDHPSEYITSVEGYYDKIYGSEAEVVTMLRIKTNKRTSPPFGIEAGTKFELEERDNKIVGFHGKAGELLHQVGVHVMPITK